MLYMFSDVLDIRPESQRRLGDLHEASLDMGVSDYVIKGISGLRTSLSFVEHESETNILFSSQEWGDYAAYDRMISIVRPRLIMK